MVEAIERAEEFYSGGGEIHDEMVDCLGDCEDCWWWEGCPWGGGTGEGFGLDGDGVLVGGGEF